MKNNIRLLIFNICAIMLAGTTYAQQLNNNRDTTVLLSGNTITVDSLSLVPGTVSVTVGGHELSGSSIHIDHARSTLILKPSAFDTLAGLTAKIKYRVFPFKLTQEYFNKDASWITTMTTEPQNPFLYRVTSGSQNLLDFNELSKSGSISRSISFGNNQDAVLNSNFNLQLSGKLSDEINVLAAITDNNIPIQPEGNTQQIQEFDKVFIQLSARKNVLTVGDYDLTRPDSYFLNFFKKSQGAEYSTEFSLNKEGKEEKKMRLKTAAALSKGKYARNNIQGIEGNQGPYKLQGNEGESFIIVLAGSEKVFVDGKLMRRGESYDYTINYNTGEITFTPNILITKDKRIVVEFEYSDKNYARALFFLNNEYESKKLSLKLNAYSESDLRNQSLQQDLTAEQRALLEKVGDSIQDALIRNIDSTGFSSDEVRYRLADTIVNNTYYDSILVYSTNPSKALYKAGFSNVGPGKGNYILARSDANGRVFQWKAPVNGELQGSYEPVRMLITPKKNQMVTLGGLYRPDEKTNISAELALSNNDINTFSDKARTDNTGYGVLLGIDRTWNTSQLDSSGWKIRTGIFYEWTDANFRPIETFRPVEFNRNWNISSEKFLEQHYAGFKSSLLQSQDIKISYELQGLLRGEGYRGVKNMLSGDVERKRWFARFDGSYLTTDNITSGTKFLRHKADAGWKFKKIIIGLRDDQEYNVFQNKPGDSLKPESYSYFEWGAYLKSMDTLQNRYELFYNQREDNKAAGNSLRNSSRAREAGFVLRLEKNRNNRLKISGTFRELTVTDTTPSAQKPEQSIIGRIEHNLRIKKGLLTFNTFYEIGSGLEEKQEFSYLKVPAGEGIYTWIDYNGDGVQQLNEFEIAPFRDEANYIRVYSQSNEYIKAYYNQFSEAFLINPAAVWANEKGFRKFVSRFSNQLAFRIEHKTSENDPKVAYNPFVSENVMNDTMLLSLSSSFRNTLYFNRNDPVFGMDLNLQRNRSKALLINGFDGKTISKQGLNLRWNFYKAFSLLFSGEEGTRQSRSEFFPDKNFIIDYYKAEPKLNFQPGPSLILEVKYGYIFKQNVIDPDRQTARIHDAGFEINYKVINKGTLQVKANFLEIYYNDQPGTALAFEMLEGLQPGKNGTWSISFQQNISNNLQLNLIYDGRKSEGLKTVHTGSAQIRAYF